MRIVERKVRVNLARHKRSCSFGTLCCPKCPNISTRSEAALNFLIAKKHSLPQAKNVYKFQFCHHAAAGFYSLRLQKQKVHNAQNVSEIRNVDVTQILGGIDDESVKEELETCQQFLVDSEMNDGGKSVFNFALDVLDAHTFRQKQDIVFEKFKCAANLNFAFQFVHKIVEDGTCRYYYANGKQHFERNDQRLWRPKNIQ